MLRFAAPVLILLSLLISAAAQTPPAATAPAAQTAPQAKPTAKKATAKPKPAESATAGPCGVGVIAGTGDIFVVQKIGLTVFGNDYAEVPVSWGLDDLVFARARAAAGNTPVRRITYAKGALDSYYHPKSGLFRNQREELSNLIRQVAGNAGCERYLVVMRSEGQLDGTNQSLSGVGIFSRGVGLISYAYVFSYIGVTWVDGRTFEIMKGPAVTFEGVMKRMADNFVSNELLQKVDKSMFPETAADSANNIALRDTTRDFLTKRLDKILPPYFAQ
ncbi:hypothetical protein ABIF64_001114 [Bradyrhizobium japonicum]|uniref:hypothetical protein n=1 Tax=Bradyrhizobium japonicum TaxID=375 RepID=UPI00209DB7BA|nr:hypothetical protein [Bradyrhizobium japonicum]MCP1761571.1 hypothetical protein [Bradyrhizobium japonicum]MCP1793150.1 hypothetical protein [Bradyrhizobium japonicum]MCP1814602.1 hypothetical protein [Bradyrhizobium japonicum]MCP1941947.1 hypothetical protein [Bradyrhizobium japonicum]MCS3542321.1 hypothetical protein [Bradyrhizobium japonicum]